MKPGLHFQELSPFFEGEEIIRQASSEEAFSGFGRLEEPTSGRVCLIKSKDFAKKLLDALIQGQSFSGVGIVLGKKQLSEALKAELDKSQASFIVGVENPALMMAKLSKPFYDLFFSEETDMLDSRTSLTSEIHPTAKIAQNVFIGENCRIEKDVRIYPGCVIMSGSVIGEGTTLYPNVTIYPKVEIGVQTRIHSGTVLGADGFGYEYDGGVHHKIWHCGGVKIGNHVEIGANSCVDGGAFYPTQVGDGCIIDNHVQIGHNAEIGRLVVVCGHTAISGSARIGDGVVFGGKSGIGPNMELGPGCQVAGGALVNCDWPAGVKLGGHPARELGQWMKGLAYIRKMSLGQKK